MQSELIWKGEALILAWEIISQGDGRRIVREITHEAATNGIMSEEFQRGADNGSTLFGVMMGILQPDYNDPILTKAKSLAPTLHDNMANLDIGHSNTSSSLATAVNMITIYKHINEKYLNDDITG